MNWLETICYALRLPWYVDKTTALGRISDKMAEKFVIVRELLAERTTFEATIEPIVRENIKIKFPRYGAASSEDFQRKAKGVSKLVGEILSLGYLSRPHVFPYYFVSVFLNIPLILLLVITIVIWGFSGWKPPAEFYAKIFNPQFTPWVLAKWVLIVNCSWGVFFFFTAILPPERCGFSQRCEAAEKLLNDARFLDEVFAKLRRGESFEK